MKRYLAFILAVLMLCVLMTGCGKTDPVEGKYYALSCTADNTQYDCFGEFILLSLDGSGYVRYNYEDLAIRYDYAADTGEFSFRDEENFRFEGSFSDGQITGTYGDKYNYTYAAIGAADGGDYAGEYAAVSCTVDGKECSCEQDSLTLYTDGKGRVSMNGEEMDALWTLSDGMFCIYTENGSMTDGRYADGEISGSCFGAEYVFSCNTPEEATEEPEVTVEYHDEGVYNENGVIMGRYGATLCSDETGEQEYYLDGEYLILHEDGTGIVYYMGTEFSFTWEYDGTDFIFTDEDRDGFIGTYADGAIDGIYYAAGNTYRYVFTYGEEPIQESY